jgi:hypothetical protein
VEEVAHQPVQVNVLGTYMLDEGFEVRYHLISAYDDLEACRVLGEGAFLPGLAYAHQARVAHLGVQLAFVHELDVPRDLKDEKACGHGDLTPRTGDPDP